MIDTYYCIIRNSDAEVVFKGSLGECSRHVNGLILASMNSYTLCKVSPVSNHPSSDNSGFWTGPSVVEYPAGMRM